MKEIRFTSVALEFFKGVESAEYKFGEDITTISAANGVGKTTVFDAIMWCLFGTDSKGRSKFGLKTRDSRGNELRGMQHSVTLSLRVDYNEYILKRCLSESVSRDRSVKNVFSYYVNGEVVTAGGYSEAVNSICDNTTFCVCTSPTDFAGRPWEEQRELLTLMVGFPTTEEITQGDKKYDPVVKAIQKEDISAYIKHIKYMRKNIQTQLDDIPVRINELRKALPEEQDWESLSKQKQDLSAVIDSSQRELAKIENGAVNSIRIATIQKKVDFARKRLANMEQSARNMYQDALDAHDEELRTCISARDNAQELVTELMNKVKSCDATHEAYLSAIADLKKQLKVGSVEWNRLKHRQWEWNEEDNYCPHCGQPLPIDNLEEVKRGSRERYMVQLASDKQSCINQATRIKAALKQAEDEDSACINANLEASAQLETAKLALIRHEMHLKEIKDKMPQSPDEYLNKESYQSVLDEIKSLEEEMDTPDQDADTTLLDKLWNDKANAQDEYDQVCKLLASKEVYDKIIQQVSDIEAERNTYCGQLDELDYSIDTAEDYLQRSCELLEQRVNAKFTSVQWSLFTTNLDGTRKPYCECMVNGVLYRDLNTAAQTNAGLEICKVISDFYEVNLPVIVDGAEGVNNIFYEGGQQIRLAVSNDRTMKFDYTTK